MNTLFVNGVQEHLQPMKFENYMALIRRRIVAFMLTFLVILPIAISPALLLPSVYRSETTILIDRQEIPTDLVETTVTGFVKERIEGLTKRLLTRNNLLKIIEKHNLYSESRESQSKIKLAKQMRENITVEIMEIETTDPDLFRTGLRTIAFTIAFEGHDPHEVKFVTEELASIYIDANKRLRSEHVEEVSKFLELESIRLSEEITSLEVKLADFKQNQRDNLPEHMDLNLQLYEKTEGEIVTTRGQINELQDTIAALQSELGITKSHQDVIDSTGNRVLMGDERLSLLTAEYLRLSARYSAEHPDLIKLRREIESLGGESDTSGVTTLINKLTVLKSQLADAKRKYSNDHPEVVSLQRSIAAVEKGVLTASSGGSRSTVSSSAPDNPRYVSLKTQINAALGNLGTERARLAQLNEKLEQYEERLFQTPMVERDYKILTRDYENARNKYNEIREKQLQARLAVELESSSKGERLSIVQSAYLPTTPERPNRMVLGLLGFILALGCGVGAMAFREFVDRTIYDVNGLVAVFRAPPIATIPVIQN